MGRHALAVRVLVAAGALAWAVPAAAVQEGSVLPAAGNPVPPAVIAGLDIYPAPPLEFSHAWLGKAERVRRRRSELRAAGRLDGRSLAELTAEGASLTGILRIPILAVRYSDVPEPFDHRILLDRIYGESRGDSISFADYWAEVSGGLVRVDGAVTSWVELDRSAEHYLPRHGYGWAQFGRVGDFRKDALDRIDGGLDFAAFDNDGPDNIPNSGDDDGYVDFVAFLYATRCDEAPRAGSIWPHRGAMPPYETDDLAADGGRILISDYVILPAQDPGSCAPVPVGLLAHETAHAFGLPDLYDYDGTSRGIGAWGLLGTGSHSSPHSPAHLSAWAKEQLGWVRVDWIGAEPRVGVPPVISHRRVLRFDVPDGSGRYLLLENRQSDGSDRDLPGKGLLVWKVDPERGELGAWNRDERRPAVSMVSGTDRPILPDYDGAADDPLPGASDRTGVALALPYPLRISEVRDRRGTVTAAILPGWQRAALVPDPARLRVAALTGGAAMERALTLRPVGGAIGAWTARADHPWIRLIATDDQLTVRIDPRQLEPGVYRDTIRLELRGQAGVVGRIPVRVDVAHAGRTETIVRDLPWGWGLAARDGRLLQASYGWDGIGLRPRPRVLEVTDGEIHPRTLARLPADALYAPMITPLGDAYVLASARERNLLYRIDEDGRAELVAADIGKGPAYGAAPLRDGSVLVADWTGTISRVTPDGRVEDWASVDTPLYQIATDDAGNLYGATLAGDIILRTPQGAISRIGVGYDQGSLVSIAVSGDGTIYAAERGGKGRITRLGIDGRHQVIAAIRGAEFFGLALDRDFLYALDLNGRQLLRIAVGRAAPRIAARED